MRSIIVLAVLMMLLMLDVVVNLRSDEDPMEVPPGTLENCPAQNGDADYYLVTVMKSNTSLISGCAYIQYNPVPPGILENCPAQNGDADYYLVTVMKSNTSLISGCAYIQYNPGETKRQAFSLWLSNLTSSGKRCREHNYTDMEHYHFNCLAKPLPLADDTSMLQRTFVRLYGPHTKCTTKLNAKCATKVNAKCAMFEIVKGNSAMFRMVISRNVKCNGLSDMLFYPKPMISESNNGSMLLRLNRFKYNNGYKVFKV